MKISILPIFLILAFLFSSGYGQKDFQLPKIREVIVNQGDSIIKAHILYEQQKKIQTKNDLAYHWYHANSIRHNTGDYYGKLLYGPYRVFDRENNLVQRGTLKKGVKKGRWMEWYSNGHIKSIEHWRHGTLHGPFEYFDTSGKLIEKGTFKKGKKVGKSKEFDGNSEYNKVKYISLKKLPFRKKETGSSGTGKKGRWLKRSKDRKKGANKSSMMEKNSAGNKDRKKAVKEKKPRAPKRKWKVFKHKAEKTK